VLQAVDPAATELYVNVQCLERDTFVWKSESQAQQVSRGASTTDTEPAMARQLPAQVTTGTSSNYSGGGSSPNFSSDSDPEIVLLSSEQKHDDDPEFTLTAASSISKASFSDHSSIEQDDSRSTTSELEGQAYKLRRALSSDKADVAAAPSADNIDDNNNNNNMLGSFMNVPAPPATMSDEDDPPHQRSATADPNTSVGSSSTSTDAQQEQLRKFLGKHVSK